MVKAALKSFARSKMSLMMRASQIRFQHLARNDVNSGKILCSSDISLMSCFLFFFELLKDESQIFKLAEDGVPGAIWL